MSYFSGGEEQSFEGWLGCGPGCNCGPCRSGMSGVGERYEREEEEEELPASGSSSPAASLNGWYGTGLSYYGFDEAEVPAPSVPESPAAETSLPGPQAPSAVEPPAAVSPGAAPTPEAPSATAPPSSPEAEQELIQDALRSGVRNPWQLTDIIFFARHPNRKGTVIQPNETELINERRHIRLRIVLPALRQLINLRIPVRRRIVRPQRFRRVARLGLAGVPAGPVCGAARRDLAAVGLDLDLINRELARGAGASAHRLDLKRKLLDLDVNGMIGSLDAYIISGCCEPSLKVLESEVKALPWHVSVVPILSKLLREIAAAQSRARKDFKHC